ncbi:MAG: fatty acid desaturase [Spirulinaceae cyanobacterium RM2_2_10]|nr:fatty acid desaturase [Spirulinaceae cyanobacterium SM2_1_0]NJO19158.1 fatty acid desaturase [Spirulinaceae cyanobacterium RM2_2_10]
MTKKSDFVLVPYMKSDDWRATWQIINTLVPYLTLWCIVPQAASISLWLLLPLAILMVLFSLRSFSLMHDCGHYSLFKSKRVNRLMGFALGVINAVPQYAWSRDHAYHHRTNGDWERYRGIGDFLSTTEFAQLNEFDQKIYGLVRQPLILLPGGFFYLAIKPRMQLILGITTFIKDGIGSFWSGKKVSLSAMIASHHSKHWQTKGEFWDLLLNNVCVLSIWLLMIRFIGFTLFLSLYAVVLAVAGAIFITVFFVQHNFEGAYAHKTAGWDFVRGAIDGSSYLELPALLRWFTADISYHNIHHLSERIPNYHLAACHQHNRHLLTDVKVIRISDMPSCAQYILWDADRDKLVPIPLKRQVSSIPRA